MSDTKVFTGFAKDKKLPFGTITQLSWTREEYEKLGKYFNAAGYINVDLLRSKASGSPYMQINTYGIEGVVDNAPIATPDSMEDEVPY